MSDSVPGIWVVGSYEGDRAKSVLAHADAGIGYIVLERGGNKLNPACMVAFRWVGGGQGGPIPPHLEEVTDPFKIAKYEGIRLMRAGINEDRLKENQS